MSGERATYLDSSAIVKLVVAEPESAALRAFLRRRRRPLVSSALARTEVGRAVSPHGTAAVRHSTATLARIDLIRVSDRVLDLAATLEPADLRPLDAIHLATAELLGQDLARIVSYDARMALGAVQQGHAVVTPQ